jgi:mannitol-specific phosphotransferase system IIBC component
MRERDSTNPVTFFFLVLPYGTSNGFVSITLPFILTRAGFSVATAASVVAIGLSANRFGTAWMLQAEALAALVCIVIALLILRMINDGRSRTSGVLP